MGIYMVSRAVVQHIPDGVPYGFDQLIIDLLKSSRPVSVKAFNGYWLDIGRADDYIKAIEEFESMKSRFLDG